MTREDGKDESTQDRIGDGWGGPVAGGDAAIDVMCAEPPDVKSRLLRHPKCLVTPHVAAFSADFERNFFDYSVKKLKDICERLGS